MDLLKMTCKNRFKKSAGRPWVELVEITIRQSYDPRPISAFLLGVFGWHRVC